MTTEATVETHPTWAPAWSFGDSLAWRHQDGSGLHVLVMVAEPEYGPRGGRRAPGVMASICGPTRASVDRALRGFGLAMRSRLRDIRVAA